MFWVTEQENSSNVKAVKPLSKYFNKKVVYLKHEDVL